LLGCSVRTLSRAARDATGMGVRELIDERRLLEARRLLGGARWDARTVAVHLGFTDPANFGRFFRDRTGLTPAAFAARAVRTETQRRPLARQEAMTPVVTAVEQLFPRAR
jgi:AraC-like DNA-binding protein